MYENRSVQADGVLHIALHAHCRMIQGKGYYRDDEKSIWQLLLAAVYKRQPALSGCGKNGKTNRVETGGAVDTVIKIGVFDH